MGKVGRPLKINRDRTRKMSQSIKQGAYPEVAAESVGISTTTYYRWMEKGKSAKSGEYKEFWETIKKARAEFEVSHVDNIHRAAVSGPVSWQASAWLLERTNPERWGRREHIKQEVTNTDNTPTQINIVFAPRPQNNMGRNTIIDVSGTEKAEES